MSSRTSDFASAFIKLLPTWKRNTRLFAGRYENGVEKEWAEALLLEEITTRVRDSTLDIPGFKMPAMELPGSQIMDAPPKLDCKCLVWSIKN